MSEIRMHYPQEENLGKECMFWDNAIGCGFPKKELEGRKSCEGIIDDVCLYLKDGRTPKSLTQEQIIEIKYSVPSDNKSYIPPGDTEK